MTACPAVGGVYAVRLDLSRELRAVDVATRTLSRAEDPVTARRATSP